MGVNFVFVDEKERLAEGMAINTLTHTHDQTMLHSLTQPQCAKLRILTPQTHSKQGSPHTLKTGLTPHTQNTIAGNLVGRACAVSLPSAAPRFRLRLRLTERQCQLAATHETQSLHRVVLEGFRRVTWLIVSVGVRSGY